MFQVFQRFKKFTDYIPIILVLFLFVAEQELETHTVNTCCQFLIMSLVVIVFFLLAFRFRKGKKIAFIVAAVLWIILVILKQKYVPCIQK